MDLIARSSGLLAYIDPGTGSLVLQVVIGAVVGLTVTAKLYWARMRDFFTRKAPSPAGSMSDEQRIRASDD